MNDNNKPTWSSLFGMDPDYNKEALEAEREKMFELFKAGYSAGYLDGSLRSGSDAQEAFDQWLQQQVEEVDTTWMEPNTKAALARELMRETVEQMRAEGESVKFLELQDLTTDPSEIFGPIDMAEVEANQERLKERLQERVDAGETDWDWLAEDVSSHCMFGPQTHEDGRACYFHVRLGVWTFDGSKKCLREHAEPFSSTTRDT